jgi:hypothetical protein
VKKSVKDKGVERGLCTNFVTAPVVLMQRFWHHFGPMQNDPQGVGRPASAAEPAPVPTSVPKPDDVVGASAPREIGGPAGPEPTRFGDWEKNGRCIDF